MKIKEWFKRTFAPIAKETPMGIRVTNYDLIVVVDWEAYLDQTFVNVCNHFKTKGWTMRKGDNPKNVRVNIKKGYDYAPTMDGSRMRVVKKRGDHWVGGVHWTRGKSCHMRVHQDLWSFQHELVHHNGIWNEAATKRITADIPRAPYRTRYEG